MIRALPGVFVLRLLLAATVMAMLMTGSLRAAELPAPSSWVHFTRFSYSGIDLGTPKTGSTAAATAPATAKTGAPFLNPILAGFYPDPSICRVKDDYYLVNSSFNYFPGIPIFHSKDLVNWTQIGFALDRPSQYATVKGGGDVSRGIYAPTIRYHNGQFYIISTLVGGYGNFYLSATDPAGPWSGPFWLKSVDGIDPSLFFDDDGSAYVMHCAPPVEGTQQYEGHRTIRMRQIDLQTAEMSGDEKVLINGGTDISKRPQWIEGPHLYKRNGVYWLIAAEGGTGSDHSVVAFRSEALWGPYTPIAGNPILTQRQLGDRADAVTCTGHADFVETQYGEWWAVFLGCQPYERNLYNTGRETFLLPVQWEDEKPSILKGREAVPRVLPGPNLPAQPAAENLLHGTVSWTDTFKGEKLNMRWQLLRAPLEEWYSLQADGAIAIAPRKVALTAYENPSLVVCRQQHAVFSAAAQMRAGSEARACDAGMVAFQNETHYFFLGVRMGSKSPEVFLEQMNVAADRRTSAKAAVVGTAALAAGSGDVELRIESTGRAYSFSYRVGGGEFKVLKGDVDGSFLSTEVAGGFQGVMVGMYVRE